MADKALMKYAFVFLLVSSFAFTSCRNAMDEFFEEMSETERAQMYYTDTLTVAHWNIGHFSLGRSSDTTISADDSETLALVYRELIDSVDADVFGVCEYNPTFSVDGEKTSSYIFGNYPNSIIGNKLSYNCNAIFSRTSLIDSKVVFFEKCIQHRYYVMSKLLINDHDVFFVETHLDWNQGTDGKDCRLSQIQALVQAFKDRPYVIICADYNVADVNEYKPFEDAGFILATSGKLIESNENSSNQSFTIDNIVVKGFDVVDFDILCNTFLSDHSLFCTQLLFCN